MEINGDFPYDCIEYTKDELEEMQNEGTHQYIGQYLTSQLKGDSNFCYKDIENKCKNKNAWAMYGSNNEEKWICLEVGSSKDIIKELKYDLDCMVEKSISNKEISSYYHESIYERNQDYILTDAIHQKYQLIRDNFEYIRIYTINNDTMINDSEKYRLNDYQIAEVHYAKMTKALLWNPFGKQYKILAHIKND